MVKFKAVSYSGNRFKGECGINVVVNRFVSSTFAGGEIESMSERISNLTAVVAFLSSKLSDEDQRELAEAIGSYEWEEV